MKLSKQILLFNPNRVIKSCAECVAFDCSLFKDIQLRCEATPKAKHFNGVTPSLLPFHIFANTSYVVILRVCCLDTFLRCWRLIYISKRYG